MKLQKKPKMTSWRCSKIGHFQTRSRKVLSQKTYKICDTNRLKEEHMGNVKPFVKWVGGKTQMLPVIHEMMPKDYNRYYEPFVGGGALFFDLQPEDAVINDINPSLINTYRQLRADAALVNHHLRLLDEAIAHEGEAYFYDVRTLFNEKLKKREMDSQLAAIFIFLSKHSFNGLFRQNSKGEYNSASNLQ